MWRGTQLSPLLVPASTFPSTYPRFADDADNDDDDDNDDDNDDNDDDDDDDDCDGFDKNEGSENDDNKNNYFIEPNCRSYHLLGPNFGSLIKCDANSNDGE